MIESSGDEGFKRIFFALPIDEAARAPFGSLISELAPYFEEMKWVPTENLHLTLLFVGETPSSEVPGIIESCSGVGDTAPIQTAVFDRLAYFGSPKEPRVLFVRGNGEQEEALFSKPARLLKDLLANWTKPDDRPFRMHLTLARFRRRRPGDQPSAKNTLALSRHLNSGRPPFKFQPVTAVLDKIVLYESVFGDKSVSYLPLAEWPLTGIAE